MFLDQQIVERKVLERMTCHDQRAVEEKSVREYS